MEFRTHTLADAPAIETLFSTVFAESEGASEGTLIGTLSKALMNDTDPSDIFGFMAVDRTHIVGAIFFSRLRFGEDVEAFLLAPVAVHSDYQGEGIGQALIKHGLQELTKNGIRIAITYGDPAFYSKVGFHPLSKGLVPPPLELSQPEGWLGQSLTEDPIEPLAGPCSCVQAFDNPAYW